MYGLHLGREIWVEQVSARRFVALFNALGPGSGVHKALDPEAWYWTPELELAAATVEAIDAGNRSFIRAHSDKNAAQPKPIEIPRPGKSKRKRGTTLNEFKTMIANRG